jgi:ATP-binding cassette subfamily B protein
MTAGALDRLRARNEWKFAGALMRADRPLAIGWWVLLVVRGILPAIFAIAMGVLVAAVQRHAPLAVPLSVLGVVFVLMQVLPPIHYATGANLGSRTAGWLYDQLTQACVLPPGMGHLENPALTQDLTVARDFDRGLAGPPLFISMDFIASELVMVVSGVAAAVVLAAYAWWAALVLSVAWLGTHWLLRESGVWRDRNTTEVREAQRHADYAYRLAVDARAAKEVRLFGLSDWVVERFRSHRTRLQDLQWHATRLRERPILWSLLLVGLANAIVFWSLANSASDGRLALGPLITFASAAITTSAIAFGGLSWALDFAAAPAGAVARLEAAMGSSGSLARGEQPAAGVPAREIRFRGVTFAYPSSDTPVLAGLDLVIPVGSSLAIVGVNGAGKTTIAKLLCRLYDPQSGSIEIDGTDLRTMDLDQWRRGLTAVFQDFIRFELPLRDNVAPGGAPDTMILPALAAAGASELAELGTILSRAYPGGTDLSGGQWQRIALARALCAVAGGARVVLLDEPTAQLDVRGEAEIFDRVLAATRRATTILISHRFSTVRHADRICVLENGAVVEIGTHDELMAAGGRYRTMFDLQAARFGDRTAEEALDVLD